MKVLVIDIGGTHVKIMATGHGKERKAVVENEVVSVLDYNYLGRVETVSVEGVAASSYLGMTVTEPAEKIFRVVERRGTVCAPHGGAIMRPDGALAVAQHRVYPESQPVFCTMPALAACTETREQRVYTSLF